MLLSKIDGNDRGKYWTKVKTLMSQFGYQAVSRVRQSSISEVLRTLDEWGIAYEHDGLGANDYITLARQSERPQAPKQAASVRPPISPTEPWRPALSPLQFAFKIGADLDELRAAAHADEVLSAIWCFRPVCLMVTADDESFAFLGGLLGAQMRRRALMIRTSATVDRTPAGPEVVSLSLLKRIVGLAEEPGEAASGFPLFGSVYVVRDDGKDTRSEEILALVREIFIPHTYRVDARFGAGASSAAEGPRRATGSADFPALLEWMCAFAGNRTLAAHLGPTETLDLGTLMADAAQIRDVLLDRSTLESVDPSFKAGFESTEHMALKNAVLAYLRAQHPQEKILVEAQTDIPDDENFYGERLVSEDDGERRRCRPDVWIPKKVWVEVETLRSISVRGSSPFFDLERKMRTRLDEIRRDGGELWLLVPSDVAALAWRQLGALAGNLAATGIKGIRWGYVDLATKAPVFVEVPAARPSAPLQLNGGSWRDRAKPAAPTKLTWADVAGYSDFRARLQSDVLLPLVERQRFEQYDLGPANGLLLFGLPGCGKSLVGRVLAGEADLTCRLIMPSDLTSMWLGEGVGKIRELFDWALRQHSCLLVIDEIDAIAPQRQEYNMHTDEKRQVNELLTQLDRIAGKPVMVVATTNYLRGIDSAIRRSGRFDVKIPVYPPNERDRRAIFEHYLGRLKNMTVHADAGGLAQATPLYTPADIRTVVHTAARRAVAACDRGSIPSVTTDDIARVLRQHARAIQRRAAEDWIAEARLELGAEERESLDWLESEVRTAYAG